MLSDVSTNISFFYGNFHGNIHGNIGILNNLSNILYIGFNNFFINLLIYLFFIYVKTHSFGIHLIATWSLSPTSICSWSECS